MEFFFDPTTCTFHIENVPVGALPITKNRHDELLQGLSIGLVIGADADGLPVLIDPPVITPTDEELAAAERTWRDAEVSATEWLVTRHRDEQYMQLATTLTAEQFSELLVYRQALRDWPQLELFPDSNHRPVAPLWIAEQAQ